MTTNRHKFFRWTPRTARITFMYAVFVPMIFGIVAYKTDVSTIHQLPFRQDPEIVRGLLTRCLYTGQVQLPSEEEGRSCCRILSRHRGWKARASVHIYWRSMINQQELLVKTSALELLEHFMALSEYSGSTGECYNRHFSIIVKLRVTLTFLRFFNFFKVSLSYTI